MNFFLVKWLSMVYLEPVNPTLTLELQITAMQGVLMPLKAKIGVKNSQKWYYYFKYNPCLNKRR